MKYLEGVWQKNKCGGISCLYLLYKKKKEKREEEKKKRTIVFEENKIKSLKFQFKGVMGGVRRIAGNLSSYISQLNNCWQ